VPLVLFGEEARPRSAREAIDLLGTVGANEWHQFIMTAAMLNESIVECADLRRDSTHDHAERRPRVIRCHQMTDSASSITIIMITIRLGLFAEQSECSIAQVNGIDNIL
jgi:hypothetical protein